jgi:alpha-beta hydrolase superfamily lysophospholipase
VTAWLPDVLGDGWEQLTLPLRPDAQGEAVCTLVRPVPDGVERRRAVLYVHGYVDYFFQTQLADLWRGLGRDFYAIDLRGHGRSMREHQLPNAVDDIALHAEELDAAAHLIRETHDELVVMGHSTGGLVAALWASARAGRPDGRLVDGLVLNSPWLELNRGWLDRVVTTRAVALLARVRPHMVVGQVGRWYGEWLHDPAGGGWTYDLAWKPDAGFGVRAAWLASVRRGHAAVARGLAVDVPVLVCASDASGPADRAHDAVASTDSVLDVDHIVERAPRLGPDVTVVQVHGGVHDLALSAEPARSAYLTAVRDWVTGHLDA